MKQIRKLCISIIQGQRVHIIGIAREQKAENMQKALNPNKAYWSLLTEYLFKLITYVITTQSTSKNSAIRGKEHDVRDDINTV